MEYNEVYFSAKTDLGTHALIFLSQLLQSVRNIDKMKILCYISIFHILDFSHVFQNSKQYQHKRYSVLNSRVSISAKMKPLFFLYRLSMESTLADLFIMQCCNTYYNYLHIDLKWIKQRPIIFVGILIRICDQCCLLIREAVSFRNTQADEIVLT